MSADKWAAPTPVTDLEIAFPANALDYMPTYDECEAGLSVLSAEERRGWIDLQTTWFFHGLSPDTEFHMRDGIDGRAAFRHLQVIQGSFAPKHEHKEAAVAYLASRWFEKVTGYRRAAA